MDDPTPDRDQIRASDADRQRVAERLHTAAAEGRLTLDELEERLDVVYAAKTYGELTPVVRDLPGPGQEVGLPAVNMSKDIRRAGSAHPDRMSSGVGPAMSIAVMSGSSRSGGWTVPETHTALALMGGVELDLREARFAAPHVTIIAVAVMGGVEITVPHDLSVEVDGFAFMGGFERKGAGERSGGPHVRITGFALMGGIEVRRADPPGIESGERPALEA